MTETWPLLRTATLTDQVYQILRDRVLAASLKPGEFIREQEVSERLQVSRTPVREALGRLASEGFLERIPHRGFRVPEESVADLADSYPIMCALEILAAEESFSRLDAAALEELREVNRSYRDAFDQQAIGAGIAVNHEFHHLLSAGSKNDRLLRMLDELRSKVKSLEVWAFSHINEWTESIDQHEQILDAIEAGRFEHAIEVLKENRSKTYHEYQTNSWPYAKMRPASDNLPVESETAASVKGSANSGDRHAPETTS
ncbi:MAG TPA: GntR family transcriptional regulator [Acidobacteriota bacterium]|nr:GntR family transcriptional regulator [Acidobacteriota bacterium]